MTETEKYSVVLNPQIRDGYEPDLVAQSFAKLFKIPADKASAVIGTRRVLKKDLDLAKARQYQNKLQSIGLDVVLESSGGVPANQQSANKPEPVAAPVKPAALELAPIEGASADEKPAVEKPAEEIRAEEPQAEKTSASLAGLSLVPTDEELASQASPQDAVANASSAATIVCPKCQLEQPKSEECIGCGVYFHKISNDAAIDTAAVAAPSSQPLPSAATPESEPDDGPVIKAASDIPAWKVYLVPGIVALLGAFLWKLIAVSLNLELGLIAWLIGGAIGFAAAIVGAQGQQAATACAILAVLAIFGGKYMTMSSFIAEATDMVNSSSQYDSLNLESVYEEIKVDAAMYSETVSDDETLRTFMVERNYSEAGDAASVTEEEITWFKENEQPRLEQILYAGPQNFEEWKQQTLAPELENLSSFDLMIEGLGFLDILFLFLGVGTAYRLGMGK